MSVPPRNKTLVKINAFTQAQLVKLLLEGTRDCEELAEETGLHYVTVLEYTRELHRAGAAHIAAWHADSIGRATRKGFKLGVARDKKRPRMSDCEKSAGYRERKKAKQLQLVVAGAGRFEQAANGRIRFSPVDDLT